MNTGYNHLDGVRFLNRDTKSKNVQHWQLGTYLFSYNLLHVWRSANDIQIIKNRSPNMQTVLNIFTPRLDENTSMHSEAKLITLSHTLLQYIRFYMSHNSWKSMLVTISIITLNCVTVGLDMGVPGWYQGRYGKRPCINFLRNMVGCRKMVYAIKRLRTQ